MSRKLQNQDLTLAPMTTVMMIMKNKRLSRMSKKKRHLHHPMLRRSQLLMRSRKQFQPSRSLLKRLQRKSHKLLPKPEINSEETPAVNILTKKVTWRRETP
jgi:hypothetical protein